MAFYIITFIISFLGISGILHAALCNMSFLVFRFYHSSFLVAFLLWIFILLMYAFITPSTKEYIHWLALTAFVGLIIYPKNYLTNISIQLLEVEQRAVFTLFIFLLIIKYC